MDDYDMTKPEFWITCDESGNTGENLTDNQNGVFSEGSHDLSLDESEGLAEWLRSTLGTKAPEIKWKHVRKESDVHEELFGERLAGRARFHLSEKSFFIVGKVVDLLLEEQAYKRGQNLHGDGKARQLAFTLYRDGSRALGQERWDSLMKRFNSLVRLDSRNQQRKSLPKESVEDFYEKLENARFASTRRNVEEVLIELVATREIADELVAGSSAGRSEMPTLDPIIPGLAETIRDWYLRDESMEVNVLHDAGPVPSSDVMTQLIDGLRNPPPEFRRVAPPVSVGQIRTGESSIDARIQIADLVAGLGASIGTKSLAQPLDAQARSFAGLFLIPTSLWGDELSARRLGLT